MFSRKEIFKKQKQKKMEEKEVVIHAKQANLCPKETRYCAFGGGCASSACKNPLMPGETMCKHHRKMDPFLEDFPLDQNGSRVPNAFDATLADHQGTMKAYGVLLKNMRDSLQKNLDDIIRIRDELARLLNQLIAQSQQAEQKLEEAGKGKTQNIAQKKQIADLENRVFYLKTEIMNVRNKLIELENGEEECREKIYLVDTLQNDILRS